MSSDEQPRTSEPGSSRTSPAHVALAAVAALVITAAGALGVDLSTRSPATDASPSGVASPASTTAGSPAPASLTIASFKYEPTPLVISANTTVKVINSDQAKHTVTSGSRDNPSGTFDVKLEGGASGETAALPAGVHPFYCAIHPGMKGSIEVKP